MFRSLFAIMVALLTALPFMAAAHPKESEFYPDSNLVTIPPSQNIGLQLKEFPRKDTLFQLRLNDDQTVESCVARFVKKDSPVAIQGCELLTKRFFIPIGEGKKRRSVRLNFIWPRKTKLSFESDFGGALPLLLDDWISEVETRSFAYNRRHHEFVLNADIQVDGSATNCVIENEEMSSDLRALICQQFVDHSFWIPAFDDLAGLISTRVSLQSKIETGRMHCKSDKGVSLDSETGMFRWAMMESDEGCRPDFRDFVAPPVN